MFVVGTRWMNIAHQTPHRHRSRLPPVLYSQRERHHPHPPKRTGKGSHATLRALGGPTDPAALVWTRADGWTIPSGLLHSIHHGLRSRFRDFLMKGWIQRERSARPRPRRAHCLLRHLPDPCSVACSIARRGEQAEKIQLYPSCGLLKTIHHFTKAGCRLAVHHHPVLTPASDRRRSLVGWAAISDVGVLPGCPAALPSTVGGNTVSQWTMYAGQISCGTVASTIVLGRTHAAQNRYCASFGLSFLLVPREMTAYLPPPHHNRHDVRAGKAWWANSK